VLPRLKHTLSRQQRVLMATNIAPPLPVPHPCGRLGEAAAGAPGWVRSAALPLSIESAGA
jgi:hypothetical protein